MVYTYALIFLLFVALANGAPQEDLIVDLPGLNYAINFKQYSGYLNGTTGRHLHYWFTESQNDPSKDPLVLWLTGGPGCSSLSALFTENGPFVSSTDGSVLSENPYSWNLVANMLFLESPACVGFSYDDDSNCITGDDEVAELNYLAVQNFLEKFPEYKTNEFFITGESYGGVYVPTLAVKIVDGNNTYPINFQGYAIGNGILNYNMNDNSLMFFGHYHGLISDKLWADMVMSCCNGVESEKSCDFASVVSLECEILTMQAYSTMYSTGLNMYNLYADCAQVNDPTKLSRYNFDLRNLFSQGLIKPVLYGGAPCIDDSSETNYLNRQDVREVIHIPSTVHDWEICSNYVILTYKATVPNVASQIQHLHKNNIRGLIYNGDVDMVCNFLGNEWFVDNLGIELIQDSTPWRLNSQVVGFVKFLDLLDFVTVKGSGHMVPLDKPQPALEMFTSFIRNVPY